MTTRSHTLTAALALLLLGPGCFGDSAMTVPRKDAPPSTQVPPIIDPTNTNPPVTEPVAFAPGPLGLRRLVSHQYRESVRLLLGEAAAGKVTPPADVTVSGFDSIGAAQLSLSSSADLGAYEKSAFAAAQAALADATQRAKLVTCTPTGATDAACLGTVVTQFGRRAFRRPLEAEERTAWTDLARAAATGYQSFDRGVEFAIAGMLQSPNFLYQVEIGQPVASQPTWRELTPYELAARVSFFLTGASPSDELLALAERGPLTEAIVRTQAQKLVATPAARTVMERFFDEYFLLREVPHMAKDAVTFPSFTPTLASAMREETQRLIRHVAFEQDGDFRQLLDAPFTFVNAELARHYGLPAPTGTGFARAELGPGMRAGLFGHASVLGLLGHVASTSPTRRGKFIRERMLCLSVPEPPADVDTTLPPESSTAPTMREKLAVHQSVPKCAGCHQLMDNLGLGLENFDAVGKYRELENGAVIDASSTVAGLGSFRGPRELGALLKTSSTPDDCLVRSLFRHGTGHVESDAEAASLDRVRKAYAAGGYRFPNLLVELAASEAFRYGVAPEGAP